MNLFLRLAINKWKSFFKKTPQCDCKVCKGGAPHSISHAKSWAKKNKKKWKKVLQSSETVLYCFQLWEIWTLLVKRFLSPTPNWLPARAADAASSTTSTTMKLPNGTTLKTSCVGSANKTNRRTKLWETKTQRKRRSRSWDLGLMECGQSRKFPWKSGQATRH